MPPLKLADGVELHWEERGAGPLVVLAHQLFGYPELFEGLLEELAADHRVVTYHLRGTGRSTRRGPYGLAADAGDLAALVEEAGPPAVVVGVGDGCNRALRVAAASPRLITAVVAPGGNPVAVRALEGTEGLAGSRAVLDALLQLYDTDYRAALRTMLQMANPEIDEDGLRARVDRTVEHCPREAGAPRMRDWVGDDATQVAHAVGGRLWILEHARNLWFSAELAPRTQELLPEAHVAQVTDGPISRPDITAGVVRELTAAEAVSRSSATGGAA